MRPLISDRRARRLTDLRVISVSIQPGATALTRIPSEAHSFACDLASWAIAPLLAAYAATLTPPKNESCEPRCTMRPSPWRAKRRAAARETANAPIRFTSITRRKSSRETSSAGSR